MTSGLGLLPRLDGLRLGHRHDRGNATAMAGDVRDPAPNGGLVQDFGQRRTELADSNLTTCGRRHTHMVTEVHLGTHVYTNLVDSGTGEAPSNNALTC